MPKGVDIGCGAGTTYTLADGDKISNKDFDIDLAQRFKVYLGVVCNFGDRGWDKISYFDLIQNDILKEYYS